MIVKRRRVQKAPTPAHKPTSSAPAQAEQPADHASPPSAFGEEVAGDGSKPLDDTQRFFITLGVVSILVILTFAVLQSVR